MYLVKALVAAPGRVRGGQIVSWSANDIREVDDTEIEYYRSHPSVFQEISGPSVVKTGVQGTMASAYIDFNTGAAEAACNVTIGGVIYLEADTAAPATGVWTNGASCANSRDSLLAAINGDARAAVPFTAVADLSGDGLWLFWDAIGTAGNVTITTDSSAKVTIQNSTGGTASAAHDRIDIKRVVNTQELLGGGVEVPLPFTPTGFNVFATDTDGIPIYFTDKVTIQATPDRIRIDTDGATNLANTNVIYVTAFN